MRGRHEPEQRRYDELSASAYRGLPGPDDEFDNGHVDGGVDTDFDSDRGGGFGGGRGGRDTDFDADFDADFGPDRDDYHPDDLDSERARHPLTRQVVTGEVVSSTIGPNPRVLPPEPDHWLSEDMAGRHRAQPGELWLLAEVRVIGVVLRRELTKFWRSKSRIASGFAQPMLFLLIFGFGMQSIVNKAGGVDFAAYVFPGVVAMSVLGRAFASAVSIVYDGQHGFLREMLVAPASRASIVVGAMLGGAVTATLQAVLLFVAAPVMGLWPSPLAVLEAIFAVMLMAAEITALGVAGATFIRSSQSFQAITQTVMYPMLVLSGALFPLSGLPGWIQVIGKANPFTYPVDALRRLLLEIDTASGTELARLTGIRLFGHALSVGEEIAISMGVTALLVAVAARNFARVQ